MQSNESRGYEPVHDEWFSGDAGGSHTANVSVGRNQRGEYRAECYVWYHDQDAKREGVQDRIAGRGGSAEDALAALEAVPSGWPNDWVGGMRRAIAEARDTIEPDAHLLAAAPALLAACRNALAWMESPSPVLGDAADAYSKPVDIQGELRAAIAAAEAERS